MSMKYRASPDGLAWFIFFLLYRVMRYRYTEVIQNLSRSFPEKSYGEIRRIAVDFYRHFSRLFAEMPVLMMVSGRRIRERLVLHNSGLIGEYHAQGRPVIIMLGHYGNWECMSLLPLLLRCPVYAVFKPLNNRFFNQLMKRTRSRFGLRMLAMDEAPRHLLQHSVPGAYIFIADQSAPNSHHVVDFLHQPTRVITGTERLAKAVDAAVVYAVIRRLQGYRWEITFSLITDQPSTMAPFEITRIFNARLEKDICQSPAYWLWTHRRWKTNSRS